jgi:hypothetical protein
MQSSIIAFFSLLLLAFSGSINALPALEVKDVDTENHSSVFTDNPISTSAATSTSPAYAWLSTPSSYPFSLESSGSYLTFFGKSTTFTNTFPTPWSVEPIELTVTNTFSNESPAATQTRIIPELVFFGVSTTYTIMFEDLATATKTLPLSQWTLIWTTGSAVNMSLVAGSGFATNVPTSTFSTSTFTSLSSVSATDTTTKNGTSTSSGSVSTGTSNAAAETLVAGLGAFVGLALGVVAIL